MIDTQALRMKILDAAIRGKLTTQLPEDGKAEDFYKEIQAEKQRLIRESKLKKEKSLTEIKTKEIPFDIPENWKWVRTGDICKNIMYGTAAKSLAEGLVPVLRMGNIVKGEVDYSDLVFSSNLEEIEKYHLEKNDLLFNRTNSKEHVGKVAIYRGERPAIYAGYLVRVTPLIDSEYANFVFQSDYYFSYCQKVKNDGVHQSNINAEKFKSFVFPLPPLAEQQRIVAKIETIFSKLDLIDKAQKKLSDNSIALRRKLIELGIKGELTEQLAEDGNAEDLYKEIQAEKQRLIKGGKLKKEKSLPEIDADEIPFDIPENWKWVRLNDIGLDFADGPFGSNLKKEHYTDKPEVRIIQLSNIGERGWRDENVKFTTYKHLDSIIRSKVAPGDIVVAKMMPAGRAIIVPELGTGFVLSSDAIKVVPSACIDVRFLLYVINSNVFRGQIYSEVQGTTRVRTSLTKIRGYLIPLPPLAEQKRIVEELDQLLPLCDVMNVDITGNAV